jgi:hypothetical protein
MKEAPGFSQTSVLTRATRRNIPEDTILHSDRRGNLKSYKSDYVLFPFECVSRFEKQQSKWANSQIRLIASFQILSNS